MKVLAFLLLLKLFTSQVRIQIPQNVEDFIKYFKQFEFSGGSGNEDIDYEEEESETTRGGATFSNFKLFEKLNEVQVLYCRKT